MNVLKFALFVLLGGWVVNTHGQEVFVQLERGYLMFGDAKPLTSPLKTSITKELDFQFSNPSEGLVKIGDSDPVWSDLSGISSFQVLLEHGEPEVGFFDQVIKLLFQDGIAEQQQEFEMAAAVRGFGSGGEIPVVTSERLWDGVLLCSDSLYMARGMRADQMPQLFFLADGSHLTAVKCSEGDPLVFDVGKPGVYQLSIGVGREVELTRASKEETQSVFGQLKGIVAEWPEDIQQNLPLVQGFCREQGVYFSPSDLAGLLAQ